MLDPDVCCWVKAALHKILNARFKLINLELPEKLFCKFSLTMFKYADYTLNMHSTFILFDMLEFLQMEF